MAAIFVVASEEDVTAFSEQQKNENTKKKQQYDLNIFKEFFKSCDDTKVIFALFVLNCLHRFVVRLEIKVSYASS